MKYELIVEENFCCAHRLHKHTGACRNLHGHNYKVLVSVCSEKLNSEDMVMDFKTVKGHLRAILFEGVDGWAPFDHCTFLHANDPLRMFLEPYCEQHELRLNIVYLQPTAEVLGALILKLLRKFLAGEVEVKKIQIFETETSSCVVS